MPGTYDPHDGKLDVSRLAPESPKSKRDYLAISRRDNLPPRCPILDRCERRAKTIRMWNPTNSGWIDTLLRSDLPTVPIMEEISKIAGGNYFYTKCLCPEVSLFEPAFSPGPFQDMPLTSYSYDKYDEPQDRALATGHFSDCAEYAQEMFNQRTNVTPPTSRPSDSFSKLERIANQFSAVAGRLASRRSPRQAMEIKDEYDVQYLFIALLALDFQDIRPEEATPSVAGNAGRADCLLKGEQVVIEFKMVREKYTAHRLREELADDFVVYAEHPDCKQLFVFVYDPDRRLLNPRGIERDLSKPRPPIHAVRTVIRPLG